MTTPQVSDWIAPLFVPATRPDRFGKAVESAHGQVIIDLEDAVGPADKANARHALRTSEHRGFILRINGARTKWHGDDLDCAGTLSLAGIMLAKAESPEAVAALHEQLPATPIVLLIESALGISRIFELAAAEGVVRIAFGSLDFAADVGCAHTHDALLFARSQIVLASRAADLAPPWDGVTPDIDEDKTRGDAHAAAQLGFGGKLCIHPKQVAAVLQGFRPNADAIAWARRVVIAERDGAVMVDKAMVDAPVRMRAMRILKLAGE